LEKIVNFNTLRLVFLFCSLLPLTVFTQSPDILTLERIFGSDEFELKSFGPARWLEKGKWYTILEASVHGEGTDIVRYDTKSGKRKILVSASRLVPEGASSPMKIDDYSWSSDKQRLLIFTNTKKVWRKNTRGDYWVLNMKSWKLQKLGGDAKPSTLMFAKFSPDGKRIGYVRENNIYVEDLQNGEILQLTTDGSYTTINGTSDWVYEEEFRLRDGFRWSPDGTKIAYWQFDSEGIGIFYMINNTDSIYPKLIPLPYPKAGTTNSACRLGVVNSKGGTTIWVKIPGDPRNNYLPRMEWAAGSDQLIIQQMNRLQNTNTVMLGNSNDGSIQTILAERDEAWIDIHDDLIWLKDARHFSWVSERDGWRHLYLVSRDGKDIRLLTPGNFDIVSIQSIDDQNGWVYYIASPDNPTQRYLYRSQLNGNGQAERLTPLNQSGTHCYQISPDGNWAFHTYSTFEFPPVISLINLPHHHLIRSLENNKAVMDKVTQLARSSVEFFRVEIEDGMELDAWAIKPPNFNSSSKYPLLFYVYGEPAHQRVLDEWSSKRYLWHLMLAQKGYLVMCVDNRGTPAPRGRAWRKSIYRQIGILASADQAAAARAIIKNRPYVDAERVGIWGWSGGGQMTLNALFRYPELYHTGMAIAFVSDERLYDTIYQERYMGLPEDNKDGYIRGSPITYAKNLKGNLLIVHGTGDDNVHYQSFEYLINELIKHNKTFSMMSYPNRSHNIDEGENTSLHLYRLLTHYLMEKLPVD
jgi:dipeptidyl-peptidase-4